MTTADGLRVDVVSDLPAVAALRAEWGDLERSTPEATGFQSFAWCHRWLSTAHALAPGRAVPRVVTVREGGRLVMLLPLQVERLWCVRVTRWIGEPLTQYGDALALAGDGRSRWRAAVEAEMRRWRDVDLVLMSRLRADGVLAAGADGRRAHACVASSIGLSHAAPEHLAIVADRGARRRERRLAASGTIGFDEVADAACAAAMVGEALALKAAWLRSRRLYSSGLSHPVAAPFLAGLAGQGDLAVSVLRVGDTPAAVELGLVSGSTYRSLLSAYDLRLSAGSPGHALTRRLVRRCAERGLSRFDLLAPSDAYKARWADEAVAIGTRSVALTLRGRIGAGAWAWLRPFAKRLAMLAARRSAPNRASGTVAMAAREGIAAAAI